MRVTVLDLALGNLHSVVAALEGHEVRLESDVRKALDASVLVLPGVGAFAPAALKLGPFMEELRTAVNAGLAVVGICLGMQLLFERSDEGTGRGVGILGGSVCRLPTRQVPHMGWNEVQGLPGLEWAYFAHSFICQPDDPSCVLAWTDHEDLRFPAAVQQGRVVGFQFHPEKSGAPGRRLLRAAVEGT